MVYYDEVILGLSIEAGSRIGNFGRTEYHEVVDLDATSVEFSESEPLVGLYGKEGEMFIHSMGFVTLDKARCWPPETSENEVNSDSQATIEVVT